MKADETHEVQVDNDEQVAQFAGHETQDVPVLSAVNPAVHEHTPLAETGKNEA